MSIKNLFEALTVQRINIFIILALMLPFPFILSDVIERIESYKNAKRFYEKHKNILQSLYKLDFKEDNLEEGKNALCLDIAFCCDTVLCDGILSNYKATLPSKKIRVFLDKIYPILNKNIRGELFEINDLLGKPRNILEDICMHKDIDLIITAPENIDVRKFIRNRIYQCHICDIVILRYLLGYPPEYRIKVTFKRLWERERHMSLLKKHAESFCRVAITSYLNTPGDKGQYDSRLNGLIAKLNGIKAVIQ